MSAAKQEQPAQQAAAAPPIAGAHNLDVLQSMMNLILVHSGRFIKEHQSGGGTGRLKVVLQHAVPAANERFQDALDELENEVRLAQTVLRRDLALLKQDRKKRELAAKEKEAEKARLAAASKNAGSAAKQEETQAPKVSTPAAPEMTAEKAPKPIKEPESLKCEEEKEVPPPIETSITEPPERDPLFDGTPTTANPQENEFDFDAMFGDAMDTSGGDNNNANADDMMDTSGDMGFNFDEGPSLLRGLEDFAKGSDDDNTAQNASNLDIDLTMSDIPELNTNTETTALTEQPTTTKPADAPTTQPPAESATNDTANNETMNAANNDDLMTDMVTENLDDLFDLDGYENPENSSFDDAFFNFE